MKAMRVTMDTELESEFAIDVGMHTKNARWITSDPKIPPIYLYCSITVSVYLLYQGTCLGKVLSFL